MLPTTPHPTSRIHHSIRLKKTTFIGFFVAHLFVGCTAFSAERLIATPERITDIQTAIAAGNPHHAAAFKALTERLEESNLSKAYDNGSSRYVDGYRAREAALAALLSTDTRQRESYANMAYESALKAASKNDAPITGMHTNPNELGLKSAMNGMSIALAYNWMQDDWNDEQKQRIRDRIEAGLSDWPKFRHANTSQSHDASNWVAVTRGAEFIMIHAIGAPSKYSGRLNTLTNHLVNNMQNGFGNLGVGQEGMGYIEYPGAFLLPAALIDQQLGSGKIWNGVGERSWWKLAMYSLSFQPRAFDKQDRKFLTWGVGERGHDQGWASLLIATVPEAERPYYLWFYDRHMGVNFPGPMDRFDRHRAGTVWSLLLYPIDAAPMDPTGVFQPMVVDSNGFAFFRNRWQDADDIQLMVAADEVHHSNAWDQQDAFGLALLAQNNAFITGAGKSDAEKAQTGILVNGKKRAGKRTLNGEMLFTEPSNIGGNARVDGGESYGNLGLSKAERDVAVLFSPPSSNLGIISVWDRLEASSEKTYTWQLNTGAPQASSDIGLAEGIEQGRKTFTLTGRDEGYLKGWILHPENAEIKSGTDPFQIEVSGSDAEIWIVMLTGKGTPPDARILGEGLSSGIEIGSAQIFLHPETDRATLRLK